MKETLIEVYRGAMPTVVITMVIAISLRVCYLYKNKLRFHPIKELLSLCFIVYITCLFYVVTFQDIDGAWASSNFVPFKEMFRYSLGSRLFVKNVMGNILLFMPYGFFSSYFLKEKKLFVTITLTLVLSLAIESLQLNMGRVFDIDDIILNVVGGILGNICYRIISRFINHFKKQEN